MASYAHGLLYEGARELISSKIGNISHVIGVEESKAEPDTVYIHQLETQIIALAKMREQMDPEDAESIRHVFETYARCPISRLHLED